MNRAKDDQRLSEKWPRQRCGAGGTTEKDWREGTEPLSPDVPRRQGHSPFPTRQMILASARTLHVGWVRGELPYCLRSV